MIVFGIDPDGKTMLMTEEPISYSKAALKETTSFNFTLLILAQTIVVISMIIWGKVNLSNCRL